MSEIKPFDFKGHRVRIVEFEGNLWFWASDVLDCLGLDKARGAGHYTKHLDPSESRVVTPHQMEGLRTGQATLLAESGLYKLVLRSDKPEARQFQDWVTREVLPAIRKDGIYVMGEEKLKTGEMSDDEFILAAMEKLQAKGSLYRGLGVRRRAARSGFNWNASKICRPTSCWVVEPASFCVCT